MRRTSSPFRPLKEGDDCNVAQKQAVDAEQLIRPWLVDLLDGYDTVKEGVNDVVPGRVFAHERWVYTHPSLKSHK